MSRWTIRPYEPGDEEGILALFNAVFSEEYPDSFRPRSMETWRHLFVDNPFGTQIFVATDADGAIVANYSSLPQPAIVKGRRRLATQVVDSCVDRAWRGRLGRRSLFVQIASRFLHHWTKPDSDPYDDFIYGLPNEQAYGVGTRVVGYRPVHTPMVALVRARDEGWPAWLDELEARADGVEVADGGPDDLPAVAALFEAHAGQVPLGTWRDADYLAWRYAPRPDGTTYHAKLARRDGALVGALVYRRTWARPGIVPLVDWIGPGGDAGALAALLRAVAPVVEEEGAHRLETWVTRIAPHHATLGTLGLAAEPTEFNLCIILFSPYCDLPWARENWFFTMGDSDIF